MNWQLATTAIIVAAAAFYLLRRSWKMWRQSRSGCGNGCGGGCGPKQSAAPAIIPATEIKLRRR